jgi:hypothetical protein
MLMVLLFQVFPYHVPHFFRKYIKRVTALFISIALWKVIV